SSHRFRADAGLARCSSYLVTWVSSRQPGTRPRGRVSGPARAARGARSCWAADASKRSTSMLTAWSRRPRPSWGLRRATPASGAVQFPDLAAEQLEHGVKQLGLRGAAVGATVSDDEFADPKFYPFWAKAEELGVLIFLHPQGTPDLARRLAGNGWLVNTIGNPLDTTLALSHLIFEGTLDRFPGLKLCSAHGGGYLPSYAARSDYALRIHPEMDTGVVLRKMPSEYLRQLYYDTLVFTSEALRHLAAEVGVSQLMLGTDHPYPWQPDSVDHILQAEGFTDEERIAMLGSTAGKLLGLASETE